MIITGIAHPPARLGEKNPLPSLELTYLAVRALQEYPAAKLITRLAPGWEQALAKAALELEIPYTVTVPQPRREITWRAEALALQRELLAAAAEVRQPDPRGTPPGAAELRRVEEADLILALWNYDFSGETFSLIEHALKKGKQVVNLWRDWEAVLSLRKVYGLPAPLKRSGAQIYEGKKAP
jgi:hypothetical protein